MNRRATATEALRQAAYDDIPAAEVVDIVIDAYLTDEEALWLNEGHRDGALQAAFVDGYKRGTKDDTGDTVYVPASRAEIREGKATVRSVVPLQPKETEQ